MEYVTDQKQEYFSRKEGAFSTSSPWLSVPIAQV